MDNPLPQTDTIADEESGDWNLVVKMYTSDGPEKGYLDLYLYRGRNRELVDRRVGPGSESGNLITTLISKVPNEATRDDLQKRFGRAFAAYLLRDKK
jgi:hypothetical protein